VNFAIIFEYVTVNIERGKFSRWAIEIGTIVIIGLIYAHVVVWIERVVGT